MTVQIANFADLMNGQKSAEIINPLAEDKSKEVVRRLAVIGNQIIIFAFCGPIFRIPLNTPIKYEAWFMDRGSLIFNGEYKICTEADIIRYKDGTKAQIFPKERS